MLPKYSQNETVIVIGDQPVAPTEDYAIRFVRSEGGPCRAVLYHKDEPVPEPHRFMAVGQTRCGPGVGPTAGATGQDGQRL